MFTIGDVVDQYLVWAESYYRPISTRKPATTFQRVARSAKELIGIVGDVTPAASMTCSLMYRVQQELAARGLNRCTVNTRCDEIKRIFRWAAHPARGLVPEEVASRLQMLEPLRPYRSGAIESEAVDAVPIEHVQQTCLYLPAKIVTMIWVQWHTGMRPGEVCDMRKSWMDTSDDGLMYHPREHKAAWRENRRNIPLGPHATEAVLPWMARAEDVLFTGNGGHPIKPASYRLAVTKTNRRHGLPQWTPNQIRHSYAERVALSAERGEEDAKIMLGHASVNMTRRYIGIDPDLPRKRELAQRFG